METLTHEKRSKMERFLTWTTTNEGTLISITALSVYFAPIKGVVIVVLAAIIFDLILGIWAARVKGEGIIPLKLWRTLYKILIAFAVLHLMFSIDQEFDMGVSTYKITGLLIVIFEIWSIMESATVITNHRVFRIIQKYMEDKVKDHTGIDVDFKEIDDEQKQDSVK